MIMLDYRLSRGVLCLDHESQPAASYTVYTAIQRDLIYGSPRHTDLGPSILQAEQVQFLYRNMPTGVLRARSTPAYLAAVAWPVVSHPSLLLWVCVIWVVARHAAYWSSIFAE